MHTSSKFPVKLQHETGGRIIFSLIRHGRRWILLTLLTRSARDDAFVTSRRALQLVLAETMNAREQTARIEE
jgi:hypothetical protein